MNLLRNGHFLRFFSAQFVSSLGDWMGVTAIAIVAYDLGNGPAAVGAVMTARVLPGFFVGPIGGVFADRWDRKKTMVSADIGRALIIFSLPFVPNLLYLLLMSAVLESLTLMWGPAKDASLPHFVPARDLTHANSLSLIAIYGAWPLASIAYVALETAGRFVGTSVPVLEGLQDEPEALALWVDSLTFVFSAIMISSLTIRSSKTKAGRFDLRQIARDLKEGLVFVRDHKQVRPWLLGIAFAFTAAGAVFSLGVDFVDKILGGGSRGFAGLIGFLATGMIIGLLASGFLARFAQRDVLFSSSLVLLGVGLVGLAAMSTLEAAIPIASALGFFAGNAYATAYSLMQETTQDELRGRTFGAAYTIIRLGTLVGLGLFPLLAGAIGDHEISLPGDRTLALPGVRLTLWMAGAFAVVGGLVSMRAIRARKSLALRSEAGRSPERGAFVVFEGGEGVGKSTQIVAFVEWLEARGDEVVITREPGGTALGERIRAALLDRDLGSVEPRAEALLYAADRAQHVADVIAPAIAAGKTVVGDRFIDSSLAYQGIGRGLGVDRVLEINRWATDGLLPDLVFFLHVDPKVALDRKSGEPDRIEAEDEGFHARVAAAYLELARRWPDRFVIVDAALSAEEVHDAVVAAFVERVERARPARAAHRGLTGTPR